MVDMEELIVYDGTHNYYNCIYLYVNNVNDKKYVGKAKDLQKRHEGHLHRKLAIDFAIRKYGMDNFTLYVVKFDLSEEEMNMWEQHYIQKYNSYEYGYNFTYGGTGGNTQTKWTEQRKDEFRKKMSEATAGEKNPMYGKKASDETKKKLSESHKGLTYPTHRVTLAQYDLDGKLIKTWYNESASNVAEILHINRASLVAAYMGRKKSCGGFMWRKVEDGEQPLQNISPYKKQPRKDKGKKRK